LLRPVAAGVVGAVVVAAGVVAAIVVSSGDRKGAVFAFGGFATSII
jgi:hypothetical protein